MVGSNEEEEEVWHQGSLWLLSGGCNIPFGKETLQELL